MDPPQKAQTTRHRFFLCSDIVSGFAHGAVDCDLYLAEFGSAGRVKIGKIWGGIIS